MEKIPKTRKVLRFTKKCVLGTIGTAAGLYALVMGLMDISDSTNRHEEAKYFDACITRYETLFWSAGFATAHIYHEGRATLQVEGLLTPNIWIEKNYKDGKVKGIRKGELECKLDGCPEELVKEAEQVWQEYWDIAEGNRLIELWESNATLSKEILDRL